MTVGRNNKMMQQVGATFRIILCDSRTFVGQLAAFDKHMNLVLKHCTEYKKYKPKKEKTDIEEKRTLGFIILRGENIVSMSIEKKAESSRGSSPSTSTSDRSRY